MAEDELLRTWKQISGYLQVDRKTCARWEADFGLPIRRVGSDSARARVFAYKGELDAWLADRKGPTVLAAPVAAAPLRRRASFLVTGAAILVFGGPALWIIGRKVVFPPHGPPVIGLYPIRHASVSNQDSYLARELTKELQDRLRYYGGSIVAILPESVPADSAGKTAGIPAGLPRPDFFIEADLRTDEDRFMLTVQVHDDNRKTLWTNAYRGSPDDLARSLADVCSKVRDFLPAPAAPGADSPQGPNPGTMDLYLKGGFALNRLVDPGSDSWTLFHHGRAYADLGEDEANNIALEFFSQALSADPGFAPAYLGLAQCYANHVNYLYSHDREWLDKADEMLARAQGLDPDQPGYFAIKIKVLFIRDILFGQDTDEACSGFVERGLSLHPYDGRLCNAAALFHLRRFDRGGAEFDFKEALQLYERAYWDNQTLLSNLNYADLLMLRGEYATALAVCDSVGRTKKSLAVAHKRGEILYHLGDLEGSQAVFRLCTTPTSLRIGALFFEAMIASRRGDRSRALEILRQISILNPFPSARNLDFLREASVRAGLGETAKAQALIAEQTKGLAGWGIHLMRKAIAIDPNFGRLPKNSGFVQLAKRTG